MIIISSRKNFDKAGKISRKLVIKRVNLENEMEGKKGKREHVDDNDLIDYIRNRRIVFLIHGYNNSFEELCGTFSEIEKQITQLVGRYDDIIGYAWPGGSNPISFFLARKRVIRLAKMSGNLLKKILENAASIDVIAHSLGCRLLLEYIRASKLKSLNNVYLMAPAIIYNAICSDKELYSPTTKKKYDTNLYSTTKRCSGVFIFRSEDDGTLNTPFNFAHPIKALGYIGPKHLDSIHYTVRVVNCSDLPSPIKHNSYKKRSEIYKFLNRYPTVYDIPEREIHLKKLLPL